MSHKKYRDRWKQLNGTAHTVIGAGAGFLTANVLQTDPTGTIILVGLGAISGLMPDVDIDGKLSNKITISHKLIKSIVQCLSVLLVLLSYFLGSGIYKWTGIAAGLIIFFLSSFIKQRRMLTMTGIGLFIGGFYLHENWLWQLGIFIIAASFVPHRSYTHSIIGILAFSYISYQLEASMKMNGIFIACFLGYISHIVADMKMLPFNKKGVKLFLPFTNREF